MKRIIQAFGIFTFTVATSLSAAPVAVTGGVTSFEGCVGDGSAITQSLNAQFFVGTELMPTGASCAGTAVGYAHVDFPTTDSVTFQNFSPLANVANNVSFTPAAPQEVSGPGAQFLLGTLSFTNGVWTANGSFGFTLTTVSSDPALDGLTFTDQLALTLTPNDFQFNTPQANADFVYFSGNTLLGSIRAFELQDSPTGTNTVTVEVMGHIGSLHLDAFVNPVGGFLDPGVGLPTGDTTPPVIKPVLTGTLGGNGWFRSNVGIDWSVSDPESAVSATQGCSTAVVNSDTAGQIFACSATSSGGTTTVSTTVKRDTRAPSVRIEVPDDDLAYRRNQIVKSSYRCSDSLSGIATCAGPVPSGGALDTSSAGRKAFTVTATDTAGNVRTATTYYRVR